MSARAQADRSYRRKLRIGIAVSILAHGVILAFVRLEPAPLTDSRVRLPSPAEDFVERPIQVVQIREPRAAPAKASAGAASLAALPGRIPVTASLASAVPTPRLFLEMVELEEDERPSVVTAYASVEDLLIRKKPDPRGLRPIDDRPIEVLAAIAGRRRAGGSGGIRVSGGSGGGCDSSGTIIARNPSGGTGDLLPAY
ncbi:MAG: hypothetical protein ACE5JR_06015 [Gemmatimonadota bacterium]